MNHNQTFGSVVKKYRKNQNLSQEELGELSNLDRTTIIRIERGERSPTLDTIYMLAKGLDVFPYTLIIESFYWNPDLKLTN